MELSARGVKSFYTDKMMVLKACYPLPHLFPERVFFHLSPKIHALKNNVLAPCPFSPMGSVIPFSGFSAQHILSGVA